MISILILYSYNFISYTCEYCEYQKTDLFFNESKILVVFFA